MSSEVQTHCIALTAPGATCESARAAAVERGWRFCAVDDGLAAMAEVVVRERAQASRSGWGLPRVDRVVFLVVEPRSWGECDDLNAALSRYLPGVERFALTDGRLSPLATAAADTTPRRGLPTMRQPAPPRPMRSSARDRTANDAEADAEPVSREELEILLGAGEEQP